MEIVSYKASDKFGDINHFSASRGEAFSNSAISKELPTVVSNHRACNSNPATHNSENMYSAPPKGYGKI